MCLIAFSRQPEQGRLQLLARLDCRSACWRLAERAPAATLAPAGRVC